MAKILRDSESLQRIFEKTDGKCHLCHVKLVFSNYGKSGKKNTWQIEHSTPKAKGGTDHLNNLYAACTSCNCRKGTSSTRSERKKNGHTRAPYSKKKTLRIREENSIATGAAAAVLGGLVAGPVGALIFGGIGAAVGYENTTG